MRMTFICEHDGPFDKVNQRIIFETMNETLPEILEDFQMFLKGCGFSFNGEVDIVDHYDDIPQELYDEILNRHEDEYYAD